MNSKIGIVLSVLVCGALSVSAAQAQSFRLNTFRSAERPDDAFGVRRLGTFEHLRWGGLVTADYAHDPLVLERKSGGNSELTRVVRHQLTLKLDLSIALWERLIVFAGIEAQPVVKGPSLPDGFTLPAADGGGMGDLSLGARVRLLGSEKDFFALGAQAALILPTAGSQTYRGEDSVAVRPELLAELRPKFVRLSANLGTVVRQQQRLLDSRVSSSLLYGLAAGVPVIEHLEALGELWGGFSYKDFGKKTSTPIEWLLGGKYKTDTGWYAGLAAGRGFTRGLGSPDARIVAQLGYLRPSAPKKGAPAPAPSDRDGDTIIDTVDACPDVPEDFDGFQDGDGCPEPDNDADTVLDADDACPDLAGLVAERGCPGKVQLTEEGELIVFQQILFEVNESVILPESLPNMEAVGAMLKEHPQMTKLRIEGHTDSVGQDGKNLTLSQQRAGAVGLWLVQHGIEKSRLEAYGCGERHPVAKEETPAARAKNRRVVFQVIEPVPADSTRAKAPKGCLPAAIE